MVQLYTSNRTVYTLDVTPANHDALISIGMDEASFQANSMAGTLVAVIDSVNPAILAVLAPADFAATYTAVV